MKTSGVIRRIDELGRVVIPKEIRKNLRIKNGETLEIMVEDNNIILKKYSLIETLEDIAMQYVEAIYQTIKHNIIITDKEKIIAAAGPLKKKYQGKNISNFFERAIERRDSYNQRQSKELEIIDDDKEVGTYSFASIVNNGDCIGSVIILSTDKPLTETEEKLVTVIANLLNKHFLD